MKAVLPLLFLPEAVQLCDHPQPRILGQDLTGPGRPPLPLLLGAAHHLPGLLPSGGGEVCLSLISLPGTCPLQGAAANSRITTQLVSTAPFKTQRAHGCQVLDCSCRQVKGPEVSNGKGDVVLLETQHYAWSCWQIKRGKQL